MLVIYLEQCTRVKFIPVALLQRCPVVTPESWRAWYVTGPAWKLPTLMACCPLTWIPPQRSALYCSRPWGRSLKLTRPDINVSSEGYNQHLVISYLTVPPISHLLSSADGIVANHLSLKISCTITLHRFAKFI